MSVRERPRAISYGDLTHRLYKQLRLAREEMAADEKRPMPKWPAAKHVERIDRLREELGRRGHHPDHEPFWLVPGEVAGTIYVIESVGFWKIGFTTDVRHRLIGLRTGLPGPVTVLATFPGTTGDESRLHTRFRKYHAQGEWFRPEGELKAWVGRGCRDV